MSTSVKGDKALKSMIRRSQRAALIHRTVSTSANKEGLLSLAGQLKALAEGMPGEHIHYDESNSLEKGSLELIIERVK